MRELPKRGETVLNTNNGEVLRAQTLPARLRELTTHMQKESRYSQRESQTLNSVKRLPPHSQESVRHNTTALRSGVQLRSIKPGRLQRGVRTGMPGPVPANKDVRTE